MLNSTNAPLKVALLSISPHNRAILEFFFAGSGRDLFTMVSDDDAEVFIVDYDHPGAAEKWEDRQSPERPGIALSVREVELSNTIWLSKPLTTKALTDAATAIRALAPRGVSTAASPASQQEADNDDTDSTPITLESQSTSPFGVHAGAKKRSSVILRFDDDEDQNAAPLTTVPLVRDIADSSDNETQHPNTDEPDNTNNEENTGFLEFDDINSGLSEEEQEQRWYQLCGNQENTANEQNWQTEATFFTPENYLLTNVVDALRLAKQSGQMVQLKIDEQHFALLMPDVNYSYCTLDLYSDDFATLCNNPMQTGKVHLHIPSNNEAAALEAIVDNNTEKRYDMEAFVWSTSLLTSQGRLKRNADASQKIALKSWPNLTRLEQIPHIMRIAALWNQRPGNVFDIVEWLDIPQRYVFAFYTAAETLNLFEVDETKLKTREKTAPKKQRGLFARLLKRLIGGGSK